MGIKNCWVKLGQMSDLAILTSIVVLAPHLKGTSGAYPGHSYHTEHLEIGSMVIFLVSVGVIWIRSGKEVAHKGNL